MKNLLFYILTAFISFSSQGQEVTTGRIAAKAAPKTALIKKSHVLKKKKTVFRKKHTPTTKGSIFFSQTNQLPGKKSLNKKKSLIFPHVHDTLKRNRKTTLRHHWKKSPVAMMALNGRASDTSQRKPIHDTLSHQMSSRWLIQKQLRADSIAKYLRFKQDSLRKAKAQWARLMKIRRDSASYYQILPASYLPINGRPVYMLIRERLDHNKDTSFWLVIGILLLTGFIRAIYPKYFLNVFQIFLQTSFRRKQTREQLLQNKIGSFMMNILFSVSFAFYLYLLLRYFTSVGFPFILLLLYCWIFVVLVYGIKFMFIKFSGWIFHAARIADVYLFIVYDINKVLGVCLIPIVALMAFASPVMALIAFYLSVFIFGLSLLFRYVLFLRSIASDMKVHPFQFFLYLCIVEILPLILIFKAINNYLLQGHIL